MVSTAPLHPSIMTGNQYHLGNETIALTTHDDVDLSEIETLLFQILRLIPSTADRDLSHPSESAFTIHLDDPSRSQPTPNIIGPETRTGPLSGWQTATGYYWTCGGSSLHLLPAEKRAIAQIQPDFWTHSLYFQRQFFLMAFYMLLRPLGYYGLHANGLVHDDVPVLIAGDSGSGKSTLALSMALQGWHFWGDDTILLRQEDERSDIVGLALRRGSACTANTANLLPELSTLFSSSPPLQDDKRLIPAETLPQITVVDEATPAVILFPSIHNQETSQIQPLDQTLAMAGLMGLSTGILTDKSEVQKQMALLQRLTQQTRAYLLLQGRDVFDNPERVSDMLSEIA